MRTSLCLSALALLLVLPARADDGPAAKAPGQADVKTSREQMSCCAGEEKVTCPRAKAAASSKKPAAKTAPAAAAGTAKPKAAGAANMVVTRDPETGELRNATAAEREKLLGRRPAASAEHTVVTLPDGTRMMRLGPDHAVYSVARKNPDGTLTSGCVHGTGEAEAFTEAAPSPAPAPAAREK